MIDTPHITQAEPQQAAVIHVTIARADIAAAMGSGIGELIDAVKAQGIGPAGPVFAHYLSMPCDMFDMEIGVPVSAPVSPIGRIEPGSLPGGLVARTVMQGNYDGLPGGWGEFMNWIRIGGHTRAHDLWEVYVKGPESSSDPATWRTELNQPLLN